MLSTTTPSAVLGTIAYAILAAAGAMLWRRTRSFAAVMVAIGFGLVLANQVVALVEYLEISALLRGHPADTLFIVHYHAFLQYVSLLGLWLAALGLFLHTAFPNNRWKGL